MSDSTYASAIEEIIGRAMRMAILGWRDEDPALSVAALKDAVASVLALRNQEVISND